MTFTVVWQPSAERRLTELWLEASDQPAVSNAADAIDQGLSSDPLQAGESRVGATRFLFVAPLAVYYDVHSDDRTVSVWAVWRHS
jgi:plasmid stabilization system protein ParE